MTAEIAGYAKRWGQYRIRLTKDDLKSKADIIKELAGMAHERRTSA